MSKKIRKKHVFPSSEVAHVFFHRDEKIDNWAKNPINSFSWKDDTIYSYRTPIAKVFCWKKKIILFRAGTYSSTTSKHQGYVRYAIPRDWNVLYWHNWNEFACWNSYIEQYLDGLEAKRKSIRTAITYIPVNDVSVTIVELKRKLRLVRKLSLLKKYNLKKYEWNEEDKRVAEAKRWASDYEIKGSTKNKIKWFNDPEIKAYKQKEVEAIKWSNKIRLSELVPHLKKSNIKTLYEHRKEEYEKLYEELVKREEKERLEKLEEKIRAWQLDGIHFYNYNIPIFLRLTKTEVITTRGARIPIEHARLLYKKYKLCIERNEEWTANGASIKVGHYKVQSIGRYLGGGEWCIKAGCHIIYDTQIKQFIEFYKLTW